MDQASLWEDTMSCEKNRDSDRSTKDRPRVAAVIPAYNEERFIGSVVLKTLQHADAVIVVDDGSTDSTAQIAEAAGARVVRHSQNHGKGEALNTGFRTARELSPQVVVTLDADGQHSPEEMARVVAPVLQDKADIVVGSRYLDNNSRVPMHRVWGHLAFNFVNRLASGVSLSDSQNGFRAFSKSALRVISFQSTDFSVESEMQFLAQKHELRVVEIPVTIQYLDRPKRSVIVQGLMVLKGIWRLLKQHRPFLYFGLPSTMVLLTGVLWGIWVVDIYDATTALALASALLSLLLCIIGFLGLLAGITLRSVRGLLLDLVRSENVL
jgi:glycosyltransferase involved in cell wall biosynthesis